MDCSVCTIDPERRATWGCDAPASEPVVHLSPCPFCTGGREDCTHCHGEDRYPVFRCPHKLVTKNDLDAVLAASMVEVGVLPDAGGLQDQPATFVAALPLLQRELRHWQNEAILAASKKGK